MRKEPSAWESQAAATRRQQGFTETSSGGEESKDRRGEPPMACNGQATKFPIVPISQPISLVIFGDVLCTLNMYATCIIRFIECNNNKCIIFMTMKKRVGNAQCCYFGHIHLYYMYLMRTDL
jgi:hypothetical protein